MFLQEIVKMMTKKVVTIIDNDKTNRQSYKRSKLNGYSHHWFGLFPFTLKLLRKNRT